MPADRERLGDVAVDAIDDFRSVDLVIAFGGDGTLLRAAEHIGDARVPVLGINLGHLGFLSAIEEDDLDEAVDRLVADGVVVEERLGVRARIDDGPPIDALNDIIIEKHDVGRSIRLALSIAGEPLVTWAADGVIVASPTGSTAYSMSAGGPIVSPRVDGLIVTPVAPHGLFARSIVVPGDEGIRLVVQADSDPAGLSADGRAPRALPAGSVVDVERARHPVLLARLEASSFWTLVREKFGLSTRSDP